ncbi:MAG: hypothetical protein IJS36_05470 [Kiritimatiellae bacterium]|nr:hypothetical protein [Kiritimatiellia bacterium]MBQ7234840.1 hypothetical protein [Kiritimatiellia bacterium]
MTVSEIAEKVDGKVAVDKPGTEVNYAYASDLLSDVMGHCGDESVLVTIQNHLNTIAVCTLAGIEVIVICHNRPVPDDMAEAAAREEVAIITTPLSQYAASVALSSLPPSVK